MCESFDKFSMRAFLKQHWVHVTSNFLLDALLFCVAFVVGSYLAFIARPYIQMHDGPMPKLQYYLPNIFFGALLFSSLIYIFGLYSPQSSHQGPFKRLLIIAFCLALTLIPTLGLAWIKKSLSIGRLVMLFSLPMGYLAILIHHGMLLRFLRDYRERAAFIVGSTFDELEARLFEQFGKQSLRLVGVIRVNQYEPHGEMRVLGDTGDLPGIVRRERIERILCSNKSMTDPALCKDFCELRYSGITVMPMINLFEEMHQMVPLELITPEWLLNASAGPHVLYINKVKRGFDVAVSILGLLFLGLPCLIAMFFVKLTSRGPIFYRQIRSGRFGKPFEVIKLRTMRVDAEKDGAVWASKNDSRTTPIGNLLRKYRIDEIPQLVNVLRGEMSFVGPRPERPQFIAELAQQIPYFQERVMVQPGITGWAQVNYPYGANAEDARRKLEFDLYYIKNMSLFLDVFILLDTVRIILRGGTKIPPRTKLPHYQSVSKSIAPLMGVNSVPLSANG